MNSRWVSTILLVTLVASCASNDRDEAIPPESTATTTEPAPVVSEPDDVASTVVDTVESTAVPAGSTTIDDWLGDPAERSADELLSAFAAVFGDVPGVSPLAIAESDGLGTRTGLVEDVLLHLDAYTDEQLDAIGALLRPEGTQFSVSGKPAAGFAGTRRQDPESDARTMVELAIGQIESRTGFEYDGEIEVVLVDRAEVSDDTWAEAVGATALGGIDGIDPLQTGATQNATCYIFLGTRALDPLHSDVAYEKVAHEVFHCFQYKRHDGGFNTFGGLPEWQKEGSAAWVGLTLAGGSGNSQSDSWWQKYLAGNAPAGTGGYALGFGNGYSALGLFEFVAQHGVDVWSVVLEQIGAGSSGAAFAQITGDDGELLSAWASSTTRQGFSASWDMTGPSITSDSRAPRELTLTTSAPIDRSFGNLNNEVLRFDVDGGVEYTLVGVNGVGRISWEGDNERSLVNASVRYCFLDDCLCPDGRPPFDGAPYSQIERGTAWAGFGSFAHLDTQFEARGLTKDDVCEPCPGEGGEGLRSPGFSSPGDSCPDPCLTGKWQQDTSTMESEFLRIFTQPITSLDVSGANVVEFGDGTATVTWGTTITAVIPMDEGMTLMMVQEFGGVWTGTYEAFAPNLWVETESSEMSITITSYINGNPTEPSIQSPDPWGSDQLTYECLGNELTTHHPSNSVINVFHRINPTE